MLSTVRFLVLPLVTSITLWCSSGFSTSIELMNDSELNLGEGAADDYAGYWNTAYCQMNPVDPTCVTNAPNPYFGPAWYNFNYSGYGFHRGHSHTNHGHKKHRHSGCRGGCGGRGR